MSIREKAFRIVISGGGTGGHIYPAIAIAQELRETFPKAQILFVGARSRMEMQKVPLYGFKIVGLPISGLRRGSFWSCIPLLIKVIYAILCYAGIALKFRPHLVIGTGGYAAFIPSIFGAISPRTKTLILEINAYAGLTNKILSRWVDVVCVAHSGMKSFFPVQKVRITGVPLRRKRHQDVLHKNDLNRIFGLDPSKKTVFLTGGSLGSSKMNEVMAASLDDVLRKGWQIIWQTGHIYHKKYQILHAPGVWVKDYIEDMDQVYALCDVVISRAGAGAIAEISRAAKPAVFIPSPNVTENHQFKNAHYLVERQAALMIEESDLSPQKLMFSLESILEDAAKMKNLAAQIFRSVPRGGVKNVIREIETLLEP